MSAAEGRGTSARRRGADRSPPDAGAAAEAAGPGDADTGGARAGVDAGEAGPAPGGDADDDAVASSRGGGFRSRLTRVRRLLGGIPAFGKLLYRLLGDARVSLLDRVIFGAALVYLFVPMDLVPDWVPAFGQMDDLLVLLFTLDRLLYRTDEAVLAEHWDGDPQSLSALRGLLERAADALPRWARALLRAG